MEYRYGLILLIVIIIIFGSNVHAQTTMAVMEFDGNNVLKLETKTSTGYVGQAGRIFGVKQMNCFVSMLAGTDIPKPAVPEKDEETKRDTLQLKNRKSPTTAFILSLVGGATILPGLGQHYNGEHNKGLLMGAGWLAGMAILFPTEGTEHEKTGQIIGMPLLLTAFIWSCIDAPISANKINKRMREQNTHGHMLEFYKGQYALGVDLNITEKAIGPNLTLHF